MREEGRKVAIVTGASGGIGRAVAIRLALDGFSVIVHYAGNADKADATIAAIESKGGRAISLRADVANEADTGALFKTALSSFGRIDVVVHCAGIMPLGSIVDADLVAFDEVIATNLRGTFIVLSQAGRHVASGGRIIALSSSVIAKSFPGYGAYIASKAGVEGLVRVLANELRGRNISVNAVAPGPTGTELFLQGKASEQIDRLARLAPLERIGRPQDIAAVVAFLAGPEGEWINAQVIRSNGGFA